MVKARETVKDVAVFCDIHWTKKLFHKVKVLLNKANHGRLASVFHQISTVLWKPAFHTTGPAKQRRSKKSEVHGEAHLVVLCRT